MPVNDMLGKRMKNNYEKIPQTKLMRRTPIAIRIDGKAFHTFTRGFKKPFDDILRNCMGYTMKYLCKNIQGCVFGYTQSDEITLILIDYQNFETEAWFDYEVQKICSIAASMATMKFNQLFSDRVDNYHNNYVERYRDFDISYPPEDETNYLLALIEAKDHGAMFDARCFNIPREEVCNLVYWRQLDAIRNSIQMVGQAKFSNKELHGLSCREIRDKLKKEKDFSWEGLASFYQHGTSCRKVDGRWNLDYNMPILKGKDRKYVNECILYED